MTEIYKNLHLQYDYIVAKDKLFLHEYTLLPALYTFLRVTFNIISSLSTVHVLMRILIKLFLRINLQAGVGAHVYPRLPHPPASHHVVSSV